VVVHYIGRLKDGTIFDESYKRKKPFEFRIGKRNVILGWDLGVKSMKIGETAILTCAPDYAYGNRAIGPIPANSTLYFEVELLDWKKGEDDNLIYLVVVLAVLTECSSSCSITSTPRSPQPHDQPQQQDYVRLTE
jgi:hypothetical protein